MTEKKIQVGIVGATGYTGSELLRLLATRQDVKIQAVTSRTEAGKSVIELFPSLRGFLDNLKFSCPDETNLADCDFVFFATPHGVAMKAARELVSSGVRIIDLAADFRLKNAEEFKTWYKLEHACPELLAEAVYGQPETMRSKLKQARIVGMAGCYPTSIELGLAPLMSYEKEHPGTLDVTTLIADSKSGISGAGRKASLSLIGAENFDNFHAYGLSGHRHEPEIVQQLKLLSDNENVRLTFVPHLLPTIRGIHSTIYIRLKNAKAEIDLQQLFEMYFKNDHFVDVLPAGSIPETRSVRGSNFVRIAVYRPKDSDLIVVLVVEDNLVKGAAGQAIQVMNLMAGLDEKTGLDIPALMP